MTPAQIDAARAECYRWLGTPHRNKMARLGVGIDCVHFAARVYQAVGLLPSDFQMPPYDPDTGLHNPSDLMSQLIRDLFPSVVEVPIDAVSDGDVLVFQTGRCSAHIGIYLRSEPEAEIGDVWHSLAFRSVTRSPWVLWRDKVKRVLRWN